MAGTDGPSRIANNLIFSGLTRLDNHFQAIPDLAESWDISEDGLTILFHLRKDVKWHDGVAFTAGDVLFTYDTLRKLKPATPFQTTLDEIVDRIEAPNQSTVKLTLTKRYAPVLADLAFPIVPEHVLGKVSLTDLPNDSEFNLRPVGTGPFHFSQRYPGGALVLEAFDGYYGGRPHLDSVILLVAAESRGAAEAVRTGTADLTELDQQDFETLQASHPVSQTLRFDTYSEMGFNYVAFNLRPGRPFSDPRLRQAWALSIDKDALVQDAAKGRGIPVESDIPASSWAYTATTSVKRDLTEAKRLLAEAGWSDTDGDGVVDKQGQPLSVALYVRDDDEARQEAAKFMSEQLKEVGIQAFVAPVDFQTMLLPKRSYPNDFDVMVMGWSDLPADPDNYYLFHSSQIPTEGTPWLYNYVGLKDPELDQAILSARSIYDYQKRAKLYAQTQRVVAHDLPYYFLWAEKHYVVLDGSFKGNIDLQSPNYLWNVETWYHAAG